MWCIISFKPKLLDVANQVKQQQESEKIHHPTRTGKFKLLEKETEFSVCDWKEYYEEEDDDSSDIQVQQYSIANVVRE